MDRQKLKDQIVKNTVEYYRNVHLPTQTEEFIEGISKVNYAGRVFNEAELINLIDSSLEFWLTYGKYSKKFEKALGKFMGARYTFLVNSGSSANLLALYSLTSPTLGEKQIKRGDEVITVAAGFPTTVAPIVQCGAVPVFVDIELEYTNIDISQLSLALSPKTKAVMIAHTLGNPFNLNEVKRFCDENDLWLIEDNCDALGSEYNGKLTGMWGDIGTSSFYPAHHITMGEGGATYTNNPKLKKIMLSVRDWGRDCWCPSGVDNTCGLRFEQELGTLPKGYDHKYTYSHFGFNLKVSDMQAAIGCAQLEKLPHFITKRRENYDFLKKGLSSVSELKTIKAQPNSNPSWFGFLMTVTDKANFTRNQIVNHLENSRIQTRNLFAGNLLRHPLFDHLKKNTDYRVVGNLDNTDKIMSDSFWVGLYPGMRKAELRYIIKQIKSFIKERKKK